MVAAVLMAIGFFVQNRYGLDTPRDGRFLYFGDNAVLLISVVGEVIMLLGLWRSKAAGEGIFGKISLGIFIAGTVLFLAALAADMLLNNTFFLFVVGVLGLLVGGLLTGIAVVTANLWDGWQRFTPLVQALYLGLLVAGLFTIEELPWVTIFVWNATWFVTSLALYTEAGSVEPEGQPTMASNRGLA